MVLPKSHLDDLSVCERSLNRAISEARVLIPKAEPPSTTDATNIKVRHRVCCQYGTMQLGQDHVLDQQRPVQHQGRDFGQVLRCRGVFVSGMQIFPMESPKQVIRAFEENTLWKLAIVFVAKAQGQVSVAAKGIQILACSTRGVRTPAWKSASGPQKCVHH